MSAVSPHGDEQAASPPLDRGTAEALARTLRAVADPTRLQMLSIIAGSPESEGSADLCGSPARRLAVGR